MACRPESKELGGNLPDTHAAALSVDDPIA
jgi:hypothetical protein